MIYVCWQKPATIDELKETFKDIASTVPEQMIQDAMGDFCKRCNACKWADGNHFKSFFEYLQKLFQIIFQVIVLFFFYEI